MKNYLEYLNSFYKPLCNLADKICKALKNDGNNVERAFYNGHFVKEGDSWVKEYYPVPLISVHGLCDIELHAENCNITSKLTKDAALLFDYSLFNGIAFEMYGVENYLSDIYNAGIPISDIYQNILDSGEKEIGFAFPLPDIENDEKTVKSVFRIIKLLLGNGFYY